MSETTTAGEHLRGITEEMAALVRDELARARTEAMANLRAAGVDLALAGGAGAAGMAGLFAGTIAAIDALHGGTPPRGTGLPLWLSAGTVAALAGGVAFTLLKLALGDLRERSEAPKEAIKEVGQAAGTLAGDLRSSSP